MDVTFYYTHVCSPYLLGIAIEEDGDICVVPHNTLNVCVGGVNVVEGLPPGTPAGAHSLLAATVISH